MGVIQEDPFQGKLANPCPQTCMPNKGLSANSARLLVTITTTNHYHAANTAALAGLSVSVAVGTNASSAPPVPLAHAIHYHFLFHSLNAQHSPASPLTRPCAFTPAVN